MSNADVCAILCEEIGYESIDDFESDSDDLIKTQNADASIHNVAVVDDHFEDEIDLGTSLHDSFVNMINDDDNIGIAREAGTSAGSDEHIAMRVSSNLFPSLFKNLSVDPKSSEFDRVIWKTGNIQYTNAEISFRGDSSISDNLKALQTPFQVWSFLFPESLELKIVEQTKIYSELNEAFNFDLFDLRKFIGILFYMSYFNLPSTRDYWSENGNHCVPIIQTTMTRNRFEKIRQFIHFNEKENAPSRDDPNRDRLYLIRPLIDTLNRTFGSIPKLDRLCVDEQMCSSKMKNYMKQYLPNKPKKWGFKLYVLCDSTGFAYKFEIFSGGPNILLQEEPDLKSSANIVVRLLREVPRYQNHIVYFDNYYTTVPLLVYLRSQGILSIGTIRRNRIKNCKLPNEKLMSKYERGTSREYVASIYGVDVTSLSWKDNKIVNLVSTYIGMKPILMIGQNEDLPATSSSIKNHDEKS
ncbi:piggyBac transposable element-derived protein 1-like [Bactrocera neohumeralis]|uniref:piggyBac transposable element-derived protein 1-like n=1 Tax=Bactrocera neohumeralis TaxID=98809 RepID=UPI002165E4FF|nr:piggyBac transposable element-derived protein 1-like [Bactrocera neohumeralis]